MQPVLSKHVANLEQILGAQLIIRSQQGLSLTKAGEVFAKEAKGVVAEHDNALDKIQQSQAQKAGTLTIGYLAGASKRILLPTTKTFAEKHRDVALRFISLEINEILDALGTDRIDLGITVSFSDEIADQDEFAWRSLYPDGFAFIVPENHRLFGRSFFDPAELEGEALLLTTPSFMADDSRAKEIIDLVQDHAVIRRNAYDVDAMITLLQTGEYAALSLEHLGNLLGEGYSCIPIENTRAPLSVGVLWKKERTSPPLALFVDELRRQSDAHRGKTPADVKRETKPR